MKGISPWEKHARTIGLPCLALALYLLAGLSHPLPALGGDLPTVGSVLPRIEFLAPPLKEDVAYLRIKGQSFRLADLKARLIWLEVIGIYCTRCYEQAPKINRLHKSLAKAGLGQQVKMLAVAAGGTIIECEHVRKNKQYLYPVVPDEDFAIHKLLGEPRTPFTMLINAHGQVLYTHLGVMEDTEGLLPMIKEHLK
ncbi:MAG: TlpA family protein disulfide reductase [Desulfarculus sp.]|nr:TlpA family protein disulfide reductase [Desulfarculus sp.]